MRGPVSGSAKMRSGRIADLDVAAEFAQLRRSLRHRRKDPDYYRDGVAAMNSDRSIANWANMLGYRLCADVKAGLGSEWSEFQKLIKGHNWSRWWYLEAERARRKCK